MDLGVATEVFHVSNNHKRARALRLVTHTENPTTVRFFKLLHADLQKKGIVFDPLKIFDLGDEPSIAEEGSSTAEEGSSTVERGSPTSEEVE